MSSTKSKEILQKHKTFLSFMAGWIVTFTIWLSIYDYTRYHKTLFNVILFLVLSILVITFVIGMMASAIYEKRHLLMFLFEKDP